MPVLIILLYYINDLSKLKRYYDQTEFVAQQMVNIIQNISQNREGDAKKITATDLKYAGSLAWLNVYPGITMYSTNGNSDRHPLIHFPWVHVYFVKGESGGMAKCLWGKVLRCSYGKNPSSWYIGNITSDAISSAVTYSANAVPAENIHPSLKIKEGDKKIILETNIYWNQSYKNGEDKSVNTAGEAFGCFQASPKHLPKHNWLYFDSVVIFTPQEGLFSEEEAPK